MQIKRNRIYWSDIFLLLLLSWGFYWKIWITANQIYPKLVLTMFLISLIAYIVLLKKLKVSHWPALFGGLIFSFTSVGLYMQEAISTKQNVFYVGVVPFLLSILGTLKFSKEKKRLMLGSAFLSIVVVLFFPALKCIASTIFSILAALGFQNFISPLNTRSMLRYRQLLRKLFKTTFWAMIFILVLYGCLIFVYPIGRNNPFFIVLNKFVLLEIFLVAALLIFDLRQRYGTRPIFFIFILTIIDILTYWQF